MAMVDGKVKFLSSRFDMPGKVLDSTLLQSTHISTILHGWTARAITEF